MPSSAVAQSPQPAPPPPQTGAAQPTPPPTPQQLAEAKKFFDAGVEFSKQSNFREALASFLEAYRLAPRASVARNIAQTHRDLHDYAAAYAAYEDLLARFPTQLKPADVTATQQAMSELEAFTGTIDVMIIERDARIVIDGREAGRTPLARPVRVNVGAHSVTLGKDGFEPVSKTLDVKGRDAVVISDPLVKEAATGHVIVSVVPATVGAIVTVDAADVGPAPAQADLSPGKHVFSARAPGMAPTPQTVEVQKKGAYEIAVPLVMTDALLTVLTTTDDADIAVDGAGVGRGKWEGRVSPGAHALTVTRAGLQPYAKTLQIKQGEHAVENVALVAVAVAPPPPPKPHDFTGSYQQLRFTLPFGLNQPGNDIAQGKDYGGSSSIATGPVIGGELDYRFGQSFGPAGIELGMFGGYRHGMSTVNVNSAASSGVHPGPTPRVDDYEFHTMNMGIELGARFMPRMQGFRPTIGAAGGIGWHLGWFNTASTQKGDTPQSTAADPTTFFVPRVAADAGVLIGNTPGSKFLVGLRFMAEFPGAQQTSVNSASAAAVTTGLKPSTAKLNITNGTDVFLGPVLGFQLGE